MRFIITVILSFSFLVTPVSAAFLPIGPGPVSKAEIKANTGYFPSVLGTNLEGKETMLPEELSAEFNLLAVAFARKQQSDIDTWIKATESFAEKFPSFSFYELPTIKSMNAFIRVNINNGMRYGIHDKARREKTVVLYINKPSFQKALQITDEEVIHLFLVDKSGKILWRQSGLAGDEKINSLKFLLND